MAKKQLRTVKKSGETGRLNRDEVRSAVIAVRDAPAVQSRASASTGPYPASVRRASRSRLIDSTSYAA